MSPNALQVDPLVVAADVRFHALADEASEAFDAMEEEEVDEMHERFVVACGGKVPTEAAIAGASAGRQHVKKTDTYTLTKELVLEGRTVPDISKTRNVSEATVWAHVEKLVQEGKITGDDIKHLHPAAWKSARKALFAAIEEHTDERLKPIFEACGEKYEYNLVRLARIEWWLENGVDVQTADPEDRPF
jgi:hypothetical protein